MAAEVSAVESKITDEEAALYDRQIRLWGLEAQNRLKNASVLLIGISGLGAEVAKNLMLVGLKSLTLMDENSVTDLDLKMNFFLDGATALHKNRAEAVLARCQRLNPLVKLSAIPVQKSADVVKKAVEIIDERKYHLICCVDRGIDECLAISAACRQNCKPPTTYFSMGGVSGWFGYCFNDFGDHFEYASEEFAPVPSSKAATCGDSKQQELLNIDEETDVECPCLDEEEEPGAKKPRIEVQEGAGVGAGGDTAPKHPPEPEKSPEKPQKIIVRKRTSFTSFEDIFKVQIAPAAQGDVKRKRAKLPYPVGFYLFQVVASFHYRFRRYPKLASKDEDAKSLRFEKNTIASQWGDVKVDIPESFASSMFDQVPAVCAIVGGVLAQEVIKAVSQKDEPINNMFFYNPFDSSGCIATIPRR